MSLPARIVDAFTLNAAKVTQRGGLLGEVYPIAIPASECHTDFFSLNGDGENFDLNVDGDPTEQVFRVASPPNKRFLIRSLRLHIVDLGIQPDEFGGLGSALSNGIVLEAHNASGADVFHFVGESHPITANYELEHLGQTSYLAFGTLQDLLTCHLDMVVQYGGLFLLDKGEYLSMHIRDDLTNLTHMECVVSGRLIG